MIQNTALSFDQSSRTQEAYLQLNITVYLKLESNQNSTAVHATKLTKNSSRQFCSQRYLLQLVVLLIQMRVYTCFEL